MSTTPGHDLHHAVFDMLLAGRSLQDIAQALGLDVLSLAAAVDLPRLARFAADARKLQQTCDEFSASHARSKAIAGLAFLIENRLGSPELLRRAATALIRGHPPQRPRKSCGPAVTAAVQFLKVALADGSRPATQVQEWAAQQNIALITLKRACRRLGILTLRHGFGPGAVYKWALPDSHTVDEHAEAGAPATHGGSMSDHISHDPPWSGGPDAPTAALPRYHAAPSEHCRE